MFYASSVLIKVLIFIIFRTVTSDEIDEAEHMYRVCTPQQSCVPLSTCKTLNYNFTSLSERDRSFYLKSSECDNGTERMVCCSEFVSETDAPDSEICGKTLAHPAILGGEDADIGDFPWMALLEYRNRNSSIISYHCAGTLINNRYVLTAAHCLKHGDELTRVHLGKYDSKSYDNCNKNYMCADPTVTVGVEEIITHEDYVSPMLYNDIGLIRLSNIVYYTDFIKPICLPSTVGLVASPDDALLEIGGWGKGANSSVKQILVVSVYDFEACAQQYRSNANSTIDGTQLCAGGIQFNSMFEGTCAGDSGGALMTDVKGPYAIEGIISHGHNICDVKSDKTYPTIFTKVTYFEDWIVKKIRP